MEKVKAIRSKNGMQVVHINRRRACRYVCTECMGWQEIETCDGKNLDGSDCPLKDYKSMQGTQNAKKRDKDIKAFCLECMGGNRHLISLCTGVYCPLYAYRNSKIDHAVLFDIDVDDKIVLEMTSDLFVSRLKRAEEEA